MKHVYGPVPSRRLGNSLGVDIVPLKKCPFDCIYCQLGRSTLKTIRRESFYPVSEVVEDIKEILESNVPIDYITFSGSGEPTLNKNLGNMISMLKEMTTIPIAVITNGSLLWKEDVRSELLQADLVVPSLDAGTEAAFQTINRPHQDLHLETIVNGLIQFRKEYTGQIWLEVFLIEGINTSESEAEKIVEKVSLIRPDKVQLNTAVRPPAEPSVEPLPGERLEQYVARFSCPTEVIADYSQISEDDGGSEISDKIVELLKRRPCTVEEMCSSLQVHRNALLKYLDILRRDGTVTRQSHDDKFYFSILPLKNK